MRSEERINKSVAQWASTLSDKLKTPKNMAKPDWASESPDELFEKLLYEVCELADANAHEIDLEAADVQAFAGMISENVRSGRALSRVSRVELFRTSSGWQVRIEGDSENDEA